MDGDAVPDDMLEDPIVGRRRASHVVFRLQSVDRNDDGGPRETAERPWNLTDRARDQLGMDAALRYQRDQRFELSITYQRFAADDRHVQRAILVDEAHHPVDELLSFEI